MKIIMILAENKGHNRIRSMIFLEGEFDELVSAFVLYYA